MSKTDVFEWVFIIFLSLITAVVVNIVLPRLPKDVIKSPVSIREVASRDLGLVGKYDERLSVSIKYWIYSIEVAVYSKNKSMNMLDTFRQWNDKHNTDPHNFIRTGIEDAHTLFVTELDVAREEKRDPVFKVSSEYDYHVLPRNIEYNDYVDARSLIDTVDNILEVNN